MPFDRVPTYSNMSEPGGHLPQGQNCVGSLLSHKLYDSSRSEHIDMFQNNSHWPDQTDRVEKNRREIIVFEAALSPVITVEDHAMFKNMCAQINMDIDNMVLPTSDGKKYVREFNDSLVLNLVMYLTMLLAK